MAKNRFTFHVSRFTLGIALAALCLCWRSAAVTITEDFSSDPLQNGWAIFGDTNLYQWDSTNLDLDVTWDSTQSNSYFYLPLGTTLWNADAFTVDFDITLNDIQWSNTIQLAVGLINYSDATNAGFSRPLGTSPNLFEFDYYPDSGDGFGDPNVSAAMTDAAAITNYPDFYFVFDILPMTTGTTYHVKLSHAAGAATVTATMLINGQVYTIMPDVGNVGTEVIGSFGLDTLAIINYSGAGQDPSYYGYILAHGTVGNFMVTMPSPGRNPAGAFTNGLWTAQFGTYPGWNYALQRSTDLVSWSDASASIAGTGDIMSLSDTNTVANQAFYRMHASQP